jgi:sugar-phosphatase
VEADIHRRVIELIERRATALPGAIATVKLLHDAGYPLGLASSSSSEIIAAAVGKIGVREQLRVLQSAEHEPYGKPHPAVYVEAARRLGVPPERCLAFEDSPAGLLAAKAARMRCIAVPDAAMRADRGFCIADLVLDSLLDFRLELFEQI